MLMAFVAASTVAISAAALLALVALAFAAPVAAHGGGAGAYPGVQVAVPVAQIPTTVGVPVAAASRCGLPQAVARPV